MTMHILHTPMQKMMETHIGERWCFICRERCAFLDVVSTPTDPESYYGPHKTVECAEGHVDGDCFPGRYREQEL